MATISRWARPALAAVLVVLVSAALVVLLPLVPSAPPPPPDYAKDDAWLCRPGRADVCATPTTALVRAPDGGTRTVAYAPDPAAPIDCFYVYPTVSHAHAVNAPIAATDDERGAARRQLARFSPVCRTFAPLYRQVTRKGLRKVIDDPDPDAAPRKIAYADVLAAWHRYLARDNKGRGVVLIGHSQGSKILARLMAAEIDGAPLQARLVAAIIPGTPLDVPERARLGGALKHVPLCASADAPGCVIAYSTYPAGRPMTADARFGASATKGMVDACVDPAAIAGTPTLDADLPAERPDDNPGADFAELPGAISARCTRDGRFHYLAIAADPTTAATLARIAEYSPAWGLHGLDLALAEGTLVDIVRRQSAAYGKR